MQKECNMVEQFHIKMGQPVRYGDPRPLEEARAILRLDLILEETRELKDALEARNVVESLDAMADIIYLVIGTAVEMGLQDCLELALAEVHASNMSKLGEDGKPIFREDGKVLKGPHYFRPDLLKVIIEQKAKLRKPLPIED